MQMRTLNVVRNLWPAITYLLFRCHYTLVLDHFVHDFQVLQLGEAFLQVHRRLNWQVSRCQSPRDVQMNSSLVSY